MRKRNLAKQLSRTLKENEIDHQISEADDGSSSVSFGLETTTAAVVELSAFIGGDIIVFVIPAGIEIPESRLSDVVTWVLHTNAHSGPANFILDVEEKALAVRHAVDCFGIPAELLDAILPRAWTLVADVWRDSAPDVLRVIAGREDGETEAVNQAIAELTEALTDVVAERFDRDVAYGLDGVLSALAEEYLERLSETDVESLEDVEIRIKGTDEAAVLSISVEGVGPMRFRFSPRKVRERCHADEQGLTLYHNVQPAQAQRLLTSGFADEPISTRDYLADEAGVPVTDGEERLSSAVLLSSAPLGPDDRGKRTAVVRIEWDGDAPSLRDFEEHHAVHGESEMEVVEEAIRRWQVPADVLNEAVRTRLASLTLLG